MGMLKVQVQNAFANGSECEKVIPKDRLKTGLIKLINIYWI